jgi:D-3-phosphoglycerate dehydrogenase
MKGLFLDASGSLPDVFDRMVQPGDPPIVINQDNIVPAEALPSLLDGYEFLLNDHTLLPTDGVRQCQSLKHVIFLGTGARSYMHPEELAGLGITAHTIKGYGDIAVAEHTVALIWAAARGVAAMDRGMRDGQWIRTEGVQLRKKTLGLLGFGGIAGQVARIMRGQVCG